MRLLAFLLIWISLGVGAVAATTAYSWRIPAQGAEAFMLGTDAGGATTYAVLGADAGKDARGAAIAKADEPLTPEVVEALRAAGVERVRVKTFKPGRWTHLPLFGAACVGLLAGALLTRLSAARTARLADRAAEHADAVTPERAIAGLRAVVATLLEELPALGDRHGACRTITDRVGDATGGLVPAVVDQRERLVGRMGLRAYAGFMDVFAAGERQLNRAWSAAADDALDESIEALERAGERLAVAENKLTGRTPSLLPLA
jgi:hypothetical protein